MLTEAFIKQRKIPNWKSGSIHLGEKIMFNVTVDEIEYEATDQVTIAFVVCELLHVPF